jgi:titin
VTLSWSYAVDNSTPLLGYIIAYLDTSGEMVSVYVNDVSGSPSHTITGLENGTSYDFSVFGINMLGAGPSMDASATPSTVPDAPIVSIGHANQSLQLSWSDPYDEGNAITGYTIYRAHLINGSFAQIAFVSSSVTTYNDTSRVNGDIYKYAITAINGNGEGPRSATVMEYPSTVPNAPASITVANSNAQGSGQQLTVSWSQAPADLSANGGSPIIQYDVRDAGTGNLIGSVMAGSSYSLVVPNLINSKSYAFNVSSENRDGEGAHATSSSTHPSGLPDATIWVYCS